MWEEFGRSLQILPIANSLFSAYFSILDIVQLYVIEERIGEVPPEVFVRPEGEEGGIVPALPEGM